MNYVLNLIQLMNFLACEIPLIFIGALKSTKTDWRQQFPDSLV